MDLSEPEYVRRIEAAMSFYGAQPRFRVYALLARLSVVAILAVVVTKVAILAV
jgi:hypothetical protein